MRSDLIEPRHLNISSVSFAGLLSMLILAERHVLLLASIGDGYWSLEM